MKPASAIAIHRTATHVGRSMSRLWEKGAMKTENAPNPPNMLPDAMSVHYFATCKKAKMKPAVIHGAGRPAREDAALVDEPRRRDAGDGKAAGRIRRNDQAMDGEPT